MQDPLPVCQGKVTQTITDDGNACFIRFVEDLKWAVGTPEQSLRAEGIINTADEVGEFQMRRPFFAQSVKGRYFDPDFPVPVQIAERTNLFLLNRAAHPNSSQMIHNDRRLGKAGADSGKSGQELGVDQSAKGHPLLCRGLKHPVQGAVFQAFRSSLVGQINSKSPDAQRLQLVHLLGNVFSKRIDDCDASERFRCSCQDVQHVPVVGAVVTHLNEHDFSDSAEPSMGENLIWQEAPQLHRFNRNARSEGIVLEVIRPDMNMRVNVIHRSPETCDHS
jgi:hypothetical protein